jgi:AcrR family transcriptional regulator
MQMSKPTTQTRRKRGEPRRLLLAAAEQVFAEKGYQASTREIADRAGVSETLMFRYFGSKAGLFREAIVAPFVDFVDEFVSKSEPLLDADEDQLYDLTLGFVGSLYDLFTAHRGLVAMLWSSQAHSESDLASQDALKDVSAALDKLVEVGAHAGSSRTARNEIATRAVLSMVAGMALSAPTYRGRKLPARDAVVEELTKIVYHGRHGDA